MQKRIGHGNNILEKTSNLDQQRRLHLGGQCSAGAFLFFKKIRQESEGGHPGGGELFIVSWERYI